MTSSAVELAPGRVDAVIARLGLVAIDSGAKAEIERIIDDQGNAFDPATAAEKFRVLFGGVW